MTDRIYLTSDRQKKRLDKIYSKMRRGDFSPLMMDYLRSVGNYDLILKEAYKLACYYEGIYDLFYMWDTEVSEEERDNILTDIISEALEGSGHNLKKR